MINYKSWTSWRIIRLVLSAFFVIAGAMNADYFLVAGGGFILYQAVFNKGCCAGETCEIKYKDIKVKSK